MSGLFARLSEWWNRPPAPSPVLPDDADLTKLAGSVPPGVQHGVQLLNDDTTPMEVVIELLQVTLGVSKKEAAQLTLRIHLEGGILLPMRDRSTADSCAESLARQAAANGVALRVKAVSIDA